MTKTSKHLLVAAASALLATAVQAVPTVSFDPADQTIVAGDPAFVDVVVSGLGNFTSPSLGGFLIDISYDSSVLSAVSVTFGSFLDLGFVGSLSFADLTTAGLVHLDEVSFESVENLNNMQPDSFVLATIGFIGLNSGISSLIFDVVELADENGDAIAGAAGINAVGVMVSGTAVPDHGASILLLGGGLASLLLCTNCRPVRGTT